MLDGTEVQVVVLLRLMNKDMFIDIILAMRIKLICLAHLKVIFRFVVRSSERCWQRSD
jgi:hypothetical protein